MIVPCKMSVNGKSEQRKRADGRTYLHNENSEEEDLKEGSNELHTP